MPSVPPPASTAAYVAAIGGIATFSVMDMILKALTLSIGAYPALLWRSFIGVAATGLLFIALRQRLPGQAALRLHLVRGVITAAMSFLFF